MTKTDEIKKEMDKARGNCKWVWQEMYYPADLSDSDFRGAIIALESALRHFKKAYSLQIADWNEATRERWAKE